MRLPNFIYFSIKFLAYAKEPMNFSCSSFFKVRTLCWCRTFTLLRYFSLYYNSSCLSHSSFLKLFSSLLRCKKTWIFLSSSAFYSVLIIFLISLCFITSYFISSKISSFSLATSLLTSALRFLNSYVLF